jgi:Domain of unknown function (DUF4404)
MTDLREKLINLQEELGQAHQLDPNDRAMLETVMDDIQRLLKHSSADEQDMGRDHGDKLEGAAVNLEIDHPGVASAIRAVLDALGKAGI